MRTFIRCNLTLLGHNRTLLSVLMWIYMHYNFTLLLGFNFFWHNRTLLSDFNFGLYNLTVLCHNRTLILCFHICSVQCEHIHIEHNRVYIYCKNLLLEISRIVLWCFVELLCYIAWNRTYYLYSHMNFTGLILPHLQHYRKIFYMYLFCTYFELTWCT